MHTNVDAFWFDAGEINGVPARGIGYMAHTSNGGVPIYVGSNPRLIARFAESLHLPKDAMIMVLPVRYHRVLKRLGDLEALLNSKARPLAVILDCDTPRTVDTITAALQPDFTALRPH